MTLSLVTGCAATRQQAESPWRGQTSDKADLAGFSSTTKPEYINTTAGAAIKPVHFAIDEELAQGDPNAVLDVRISGNEQIGAADILKILKTRKGRPYSEPVLEEDKRALMQKRWFFDVKPKVEKTPNGYIVTFLFIERPIIHSILVIGNRIHTRKTLEEEANLKVGDALDPITVHQAKERIMQFYRDSGHYRVHVEILSGDRIGDRGVVFLISEGTKQRVLSTEIEGVRVTSEGRVKTQIQTKPGWFFWINSEFTRQKLDEDIETLTAYFRNLGFFYAKVDAQFEETEGFTGLGKNRAWIKVKFVVDEGPRCRVRDVRFIGNKVFSSEELLKTMKLPKEQYFYQDMLQVDMDKIKEKYGDEGYVFAMTMPDPRIDEDFVDVVVNVQEGPRCYLRTLNIEIAGNEGADPYTKWHPILNRSSLRPGEVLRTSEINNTRRRLMASQLFNANPTQGAIPEFLFELDDATKEMIEADARREKQLAEAEPPIRGQVAEEQSWMKTEKILDEHNLKIENALERFAEFFRIKPRTPKHDEGAFLFRRPTDIYRGQVFSAPRQATPAYQPPSLAPAAQPNVWANTPNVQTHVGSIAPTVTHLTPQQQQPAPVLYPVTSTGPYGTTYQTPGQTPVYTPTAMTTVSGMAVQGMPTDITPSEYKPQTYLSQPSGGTYVGSNVLYNSGMVFGQHTQTQHTAPARTGVVLGNPYALTDENGTVRYDLSAPLGVSNKIYPTDGTIVVQETRTGQLMMSVAVSSDSGLMGRFIIEEQNFDILNFPKGWRLNDWKNAFRGKGQRFRIEAMPGTEVQRYSASWDTPYLFDLDYSFGVNGFYYERYYDEWYEDRVGGGLSFGKLWTPDFSTRLSLGGQQVNVYRPIMMSQDLYDALGTHPMYTVGLEASHNTRDSEYMPTEGHLLSVSVEQVLGDYQFVRGGYDFRKYFMLRERPDRSGRWVLGLRSSMNISEKNAPIYERYFGGGFTSLRGFEYRGVSPRDENGTIIGGCMEFYNSAELVFPITADDMIRGSVFLDTGTVERSLTKWDSNYRVAAGFGLRLTIPMMGPAPIAIDFAFPISSEKSDVEQVFSFNVGFMR